ncbi:MAG: sulfate adenylyltransferase [Candidatus Bathyarchaeia archaeon]
MAPTIPDPHGGVLIDRTINAADTSQLLKDAHELPAIRLREASIFEARNIASGLFSPLEGFMTQAEYDSVIHEGRLSSGLPWTIPIVLDASDEELADVREGDTLRLVHENSEFTATMQLEEIYSVDKAAMAKGVFGTSSVDHPGVANVMRLKKKFLAGKIRVIEAGASPFPQYTMTPRQTREMFKQRGWRTVVGFQTRNIPHIGHEYLQKTALTFLDGLFINPVVGRKKQGDFRDDVILEAYRVLIQHYYPPDRVVLGIFQTDMRYAGPREAIFHAVVRKNFGCSHFIVGRDHAGVGSYYPPYAAQEIFRDYPDLGIEPLFFTSFFYCRICGSVASEKTCPHNAQNRVEFSGTTLRRTFKAGNNAEHELIRSEVADVLSTSPNPFV